MHYLPLPRRTRRPLLFPPGLLALAWLLCLGCAVLLQMRGVGPRRTVMQITLPELHPSEYSPFIPPAYCSEIQLEAYRRWQTVEFTGAQWHDVFNRLSMRGNLSALQTDTTYLLGSRTEFTQKALYSDLVSALDFINKIGVEDYWLDTRHNRTTLYAFRKPHQQDSLLLAPCGGLQITTIYSSESDAQGNFSHLFSPNWRNSTLLLLLMSLLSFWQLRRRR